jgi:hypothetical protein
MSKLTLDEAIKHCLEVAEKNETQADKWQEEGGEEWGKTTACRECAADHRQLAEWLMELKDLRAEQNDQYVFIHELMSELKEAKRLLKLAVEDFDEIRSYLSEPYSHICEKRWRYADEVLKLIES